MTLHASGCPKAHTKKIVMRNTTASIAPQILATQTERGPHQAGSAGASTPHRADARPPVSCSPIVAVSRPFLQAMGRGRSPYRARVNPDRPRRGNHRNQVVAATPIFPDRLRGRSRGRSSWRDGCGRAWPGWSAPWRRRRHSRFPSDRSRDPRRHHIPGPRRSDRVPRWHCGHAPRAHAPRWHTETTSTPSITKILRNASGSRARAVATGTGPTPGISHTSPPSTWPRRNAVASIRRCTTVECPDFDLFAVPPVLVLPVP